MRDTRLRAGLIAAAVLCAGLATARGAAAASRRGRYERALVEGRRLAAEGQWDEALCALGPWGQRMEQLLQRQIGNAQARGETHKLLRLYEAYFRYYPFGSLYWHGDWRKWGNAACEYAKLLEKMGRLEADGPAAQTVAAAATYRKLMAAHGRNKEPEVLPLVDEIVGKYPKSIFCPAAVLTLANVTAQKRANGAEAVPVCEKYLPLLKEGGAGERSRILVCLVLAQASTQYGGDPDRLRKGIATYLDIARRTNVAYEKRMCLLKAAKAALKIGEGDALVESRKLFGEYLARYATAVEADEARRGLTQTYLAEGKPDEALRRLRELEKQSPKGSDFSQPLFDISRTCFGKKQYDKSLAILQEIVRRYPNSPASSMAWLGMGEVYDKLGREAEMVQAYRNAAGKPSVGTQTNIMDASNTHNRAHEWLGKYYAKKQNWTEALKWWRSWRPSSWCGTCAGSMQSRKAHGIALCLAKLGKADEALKTLEPMVFKDRIGCGADVAVMLVDICRERGKLGELEIRLRETLKKNRHNIGAKKALEYAAMIRMAEKGDVASLWKHLSGHPCLDYRPEWQVTRAADLLVSIPQKAQPFALAKMSGEGNDARWAAVLLGRMKAPQTLALVRSKVQAEENCWCLRDYFYALALLGTPEAYAQLKHYAAHGKDNRGIMAKKMLEKYPAPGDAAKALRP